jgi:uncharacterized protein with von Willebrand factor type A (vWA) domain
MSTPEDPSLVEVGAPAEALTPAEMQARVTRWRLVLGEAAQAGLGGQGLTGTDLALDRALGWLYGRDPDLAKRGIRDRSAGGQQGGSEDSTLEVPDWINEVHKLFPKEAIERLERDAVERFQIHEVVTNPDVLERLEPSQVLLQAVLKTKHLMNPRVLELARELARKVIQQLMEKLAREIRTSFLGTRERKRRSLLRVAKNFDARRTIRANLAHYDTKPKKMLIEKPFFVSRVRPHSTRYQLILLVDESGSMMGSVIHAAVTAACLWGLPALKTHLCIFDTQVVDLTEQVTDPVEVLMKVQLGGGTDIARAVRYAATLVENPRRAIVVCISDFYEGGNPEDLVQQVKSLCQQGTTVLGLAALDEEAEPNYDRALGARLVDVGAHIGAMTPGQLAAWVAEKVRA